MDDAKLRKIIGQDALKKLRDYKIYEAVKHLIRGRIELFRWSVLEDQEGLVIEDEAGVVWVQLPLISICETTGCGHHTVRNCLIDLEEDGLLRLGGAYGCDSRPLIISLPEDSQHNVKFFFYLALYKAGLVVRATDLESELDQLRSDIKTLDQYRYDFICGLYQSSSQFCARRSPK